MNEAMEGQTQAIAETVVTRAGRASRSWVTRINSETIRSIRSSSIMLRTIHKLTSSVGHTQAHSRAHPQGQSIDMIRDESCVRGPTVGRYIYRP